MEKVQVRYLCASGGDEKKRIDEIVYQSLIPREGDRVYFADGHIYSVELVMWMLGAKYKPIPEDEIPTEKQLHVVWIHLNYMGPMPRV